MRLARTGIFLMAVFLFAFAGCKKEREPEPSRAPWDAAADPMMSVYDQTTQAVRAGNVEKYRALRDPAELQAALDREALRRIGETWPDPRRFMQSEFKQTETAARLVLWRDAEDRAAGGAAQAEFLILMFKKHGEEWKLGRVARLARPKKNVKFAAQTLDEKDLEAYPL